MRWSRGALTAPSVLCTILSLAGCGDREAERGVWFVHATDPHLFEERKSLEREPGETEAQCLDRQKEQDALVARNEEESGGSFERFLQTIQALPDTDDTPAFLLLTGDIAYAERPIDRDARLEALKSLLGTRADLTIYFVPGNNDVELENPGNLADSRAFLDDLRRDLPDGPSLVDLTDCYGIDHDRAAGCTHDIAGTRFRLIGFPTFSFKKAKEIEPWTPPCGDPEPAGAAAGSAPRDEAPRPQVPAQATAGRAAELPAPSAADGDVQPVARAAPPDAPSVQRSYRDRLHERWIHHLGSLVEDAQRDGRRVLLATHIPDLNDPYDQAQGKLDETRSQYGAPPWSPWLVSEDLYEDWRRIVDSPTVSRVLAGHFHDNHREIYRPPYTWERDPPGTPVVRRPDRDKLWIAPPLGARLQEASPIQARGFALVGLVDGQPVRRLYWYDQARGVFEPEEPARRVAEQEELGRAPARRPFRDWLWELPGEADPLGKAATILLAFTAAFLTIVAIWKIPPPDTRLAPAVDPTTGRPLPPSAAPAGAGASPFDNNFSRTVLGGLTGLASVAFLESFWERGVDAELDLKTYYIVCFLLFFLLLLLGYSLLRGFVEAIRSRLASLHHFRERTRNKVANAKTAQQSEQDGKDEPLLLYWLRRGRRWLLTHRATFLVFFDTAFNVVQGQNQLETAVLGSTILDLQKNIVATVDRFGEEIQRQVRHALQRQGCSPSANDCRVNISVLSDDGQALHYVSLGRGSLLRPFGSRSVAWVAVKAGQGRWWFKSYDAEKSRIVAYDNSAGELRDWETTVLLSSVFEPRGPLDYEAFLVLPFPWLRGGERQEERAGAIHVSFAKEEYFEKLWGIPPKVATSAAGAAAPAAGEAGGAETPAAPGPVDATKDDGGRPPLSRNPYHGWRNLVRMSANWADVPATHSDQQVPIPRDPQLNAVLVFALAALPEVLRNFNHTLFEDLIKPRP